MDAAEANRLVDSVIASAALDERIVDPEFRPTLLRIVRGEVSADEVVNQVIDSIPTAWRISDEQYDDLQQVLDRPARDLPRLRALLTDPCSNARRCGNRATTVRYNGVRNVRMCEACAAEHDEQE